MSELMRLSSIVIDLKKSVTPALYARDFKAAVKAGEFPAVELAERFRLPGAKVGKGERKARDTADFAVRDDETFRAWHEATVARLSASNGRPSRGVPLAALESGQIAFEAAAERTRQRLLSAQEAATRSRARKQNGGGETEPLTPAIPAPTYTPRFE